MQFIQEHWGVIAAILFGISELLASIPSIQANSIFQLLKGWLASQKK